MDPDLDDTVARPTGPREHVERTVDRTVELIRANGADLEDTITMRSPDTETTIDVRAGSSASAAAAGAPPSDSPAGAAPPALVEPPRATPPALDSTIPDVSGNIWSEPLPVPPQPFRIRLDDGTLVPLDQPVYLGRRPSVPRIHPGGVPLLVTLDSPQRDVSSTHLALTTVGGAIVARDLKSTNGSIVHVPGSAPHTLLGGESAVLTPGTVIELGDGNSIELLGPDRGPDEVADNQ